MNESDLLRKLGAAATGDTPPRVQVVAHVMERIHRREESRDGLLWIAAAISSSLAVVAIVAAAQMYNTYSEPLGHWVASADTVLP